MLVVVMLLRHLELASWIKYQSLMTMGTYAFLYLYSLLMVRSDVVGVVTLTNLSSKMLKGSVKRTDSVMKALYKQFEMVGT